MITLKSSVRFSKTLIVKFKAYHSDILTDCQKQLDKAKYVKSLKNILNIPTCFDLVRGFYQGLFYLKVKGDKSSLSKEILRETSSISPIKSCGET